MKLGIRLESLGVPLRRAIVLAQQADVTGVQLDAVGELGPAKLSQSGRRELRHLLRSHNLELTALGCPMRHGLDIAEGLNARIDFIQQVMSLSFDLGPRIVITEAGEVPTDVTKPRGLLLTDSLKALGQHGDRTGSILALETGRESGETLRKFLDSIDTGGLGANFDPGNLMMANFDPYAAAQALGERVVHAHAKDARKSSASRTAAEMPLGHGDIDWMRMAGVLEEIEYRGWLVIERESGERRQADTLDGAAFLKRFIH